ncbi:copper chaperone PCu(A)C [Kitasatospora sp. NPDC097691]|uniref:copper chaperone PCu(A)C n=1 Tax=Kitasatospora sp. NPDC097691 TaxID=3157231 RepID=UPI00332F9BB5
MSRRVVAALPPLAVAATLVLLTAWSAAGRAGRAAPVEAVDAKVLVPATPGAPTAALVVLRNPGDVPDRLTGARWGSSGEAILKEHVHRGASGSWTPVAGATVPARGELRMSPEGTDLLLPRPPTLRPGDRLELTLRFRDTPDLVVQALAVPPGGLGASAR